MNANNVLRVEATNDEILAALHAILLGDIAVPASTAVTVLYGTYATQAKVDASFDPNKKFTFIFGLGHGDKNNFYGYRNSVIFSTAVNSLVVTDAVVYLLSCNCAQNLGKSLVVAAAGGPKARAFIGYEKPWVEPQTRALEQLYLREPEAIVKAVASGSNSNATKIAASNAHTAARATLVASSATPEDVSRFDINHGCLAAPWNRVGYGGF